MVCTIVCNVTGRRHQTLTGLTLCGARLDSQASPRRDQAQQGGQMYNHSYPTPSPHLPGCHMTDSVPDTAATLQQSARHGMRRGFVEVAAAAAVTLVHYSCEACCSSTAAKNRNNRHRGSSARAAMGNTSCCDQPSQTCLRHHSPVKLTPHIAQ